MGDVDSDKANKPPFLNYRGKHSVSANKVASIATLQTLKWGCFAFAAMAVYVIAATRSPNRENQRIFIYAPAAVLLFVLGASFNRKLRQRRKLPRKVALYLWQIRARKFESLNERVATESDIPPLQKAEYDRLQREFELMHFQLLSDYSAELFAGAGKSVIRRLRNTDGTIIAAIWLLPQRQVDDPSLFDRTWIEAVSTLDGEIYLRTLTIPASLSPEEEPPHSKVNYISRDSTPRELIESHKLFVASTQSELGGRAVVPRLAAADCEAGRRRFFELTQQHFSKQGFVSSQDVERWLKPLLPLPFVREVQQEVDLLRAQYSRNRSTRGGSNVLPTCCEGQSNENEMK